MEQCQLNMAGEVKDSSQIHVALFELSKTHVSGIILLKHYFLSVYNLKP